MPIPLILKTNIYRYLYCQKNLHLRSTLMRIIASVVMINFVIGEHETLIFDATVSNVVLGIAKWFSNYIDELTYFIIFLSVLFGLGVYQKITKPLFIMFSIIYLYIFDHEISEIVPTIWSYTVPLPIILFTLLFLNTNALSVDSFLTKEKLKKTTHTQSFIFSFYQLYIPLIFFQSAISKLMVTGPTWFLEADILLTHIKLLNAPAGFHLTQYPFILKSFAFMTGFFELLGFGILYLSRKVYLLFAIVFHLMTHLIMEISFIFIYPFYFPIFLDLNWLTKKLKLDNK